MRIEEENGTKERRANKRFKCIGYAEVVVPDSEFLFRGEIRDISLTGCYVATRARLKVDRSTEVEIRFTVSGVQVHSFARVIQIRPGHGVGFEFASCDERTEKAFLGLVRKFTAAA